MEKKQIKWSKLNVTNFKRIWLVMTVLVTNLKTIQVINQIRKVTKPRNNCWRPKKKSRTKLT